LKSAWQRNLPLFVGYRGGMLLLVYIAISLRFYQSLGLNLSQIGVLYAIAGVMLLVFDIPTGFIADRIGYRPMLLIGVSVQALVFLLLANTYWQWPLYPLHVLWGIGIAIARGAEGPLGRRSADIVGADFARYARFAIAAGGICEGVASLGAAAIAWEWPVSGPRIAMGAQAAIYVALLYFPWRMHEERTPVDRTGTKAGSLVAFVSQRLRLLVHTIGTEMRAKSEVRWLVFYGAVISCTTLTVVNLVQPMFETLHLQVWQFGVWWAVYHFLWAGFSLSAGWYERMLGRWAALASLVVLSVVANAAMALTSNASALAVLVLFFFIRGIQMPIILDYMTGVVQEDRRATLLAVQSSVTYALYSVMTVVLGYTMHHLGVRAAFTVSLVVYGVLGALCIGQLKPR
jgi:predicted MFS family arabinose efflux permease